MPAMTWGEFKKRAEEAGITDDMEIDYIDISNPQTGDGWGSPDFYPEDNREGVVIHQ